MMFSLFVVLLAGTTQSQWKKGSLDSVEVSGFVQTRKMILLK